MELALLFGLVAALVGVFGYLFWLAFFDNYIYFEDEWDDDDEHI